MKIIQIACDEYRLHALTEDGDVWVYGSDWTMLPPLPTEDEGPRPKRLNSPQLSNTADLQATARAG
jgi:hypothetical protein